MAKQSARAKAKDSLICPRPGGDGHQVHNQILLALPRNERERLLPKLAFNRASSCMRWETLCNPLISATLA
jgi:hypothetical protein